MLRRRHRSARCEDHDGVAITAPTPRTRRTRSASVVSIGQVYQKCTALLRDRARAGSSNVTDRAAMRPPISNLPPEAPIGIPEYYAPELVANAGPQILLNARRAQEQLLCRLPLILALTTLPPLHAMTYRYKLDNRHGKERSRVLYWLFAAPFTSLGVSTPHSSTHVLMDSCTCWTARLAGDLLHYSPGARRRLFPAQCRDSTPGSPSCRFALGHNTKIGPKRT